MRLAVISDVHGNRLALEAVLADIARQGVDLTVNLGDLVSGPLEPAAAAELLMAAAMPTVRGNHERGLNEVAKGAPDPVDDFARAALSPRQLDWLRALPATLVVEDEIFLCHGTPASDIEPWLDDWWNGRETTMPDEDEVTAKAFGVACPVMLCGHTHLARAVRLRDGRLIVNPGSVGLQLNHGSPDARYALLERRGADWFVGLRSVPYDHHGAARQAIANGFPRWAEALATGWAGPEGLFGGEPLSA
ncbi:MAG TPA: metallophosphoesterase family protein [Devosiaceae bacterium]|jgi:putative phosphoesterase|nr:metallophosphoesterase family protein [Devosiaceae bacterium]